MSSALIAEIVTITDQITAQRAELEALGARRRVLIERAISTDRATYSEIRRATGLSDSFLCKEIRRARVSSSA